MSTAVDPSRKFTHRWASVSNLRDKFSTISRRTDSARSHLQNGAEYNVAASTSVDRIRAPNSIRDPVTQKVRFLWSYFRARNRELHSKQRLAVRDDLLYLEACSKKERSGAWCRGQKAEEAAKAAIDVLEQAPTERVYRDENGREFSLSQLFGEMPDHPWFAGTLDEHLELKRRFFLFRLHHRLEKPLERLREDRAAWSEAQAFLRELRQLSGIKKDWEVETDRGSIQALQYIGASRRKRGSIVQCADRSIAKLEEALKNPERAFERFCAGQKRRDSFSGIEDDHWLEVSQNPYGMEMEQWLMAPLLSYADQQREAVKILVHLFDRYCNHRFVRTYHADRGQGDLQPEHHRWNERAIRVLEKNGYAHFKPDRDHVNDVIQNFYAAKASFSQVLRSIQWFVEKYRRPPEAIAGKKRLGQPLPRRIRRFDDGLIDPRRSDKTPLLKHHIERAEKWNRRWGTK